jgi:hypothetical protein
MLIGVLIKIRYDRILTLVSEIPTADLYRSLDKRLLRACTRQTCLITVRITVSTT